MKPLKNIKEEKMKKVTYCLMALFITLMVSVATLEAATVITSLPYTITTQGYYVINQNLKANWHGIKVQANNVTIDLKGYSISGNNASGGYGVYMNGCTNVEIRNGTIRNFGSHGIYEESDTSGNSHRVINVRVVNNKGAGIFLAGSTYIANNYMIKDCTVSNNGHNGISVGFGSMVTGNTIHNNGSHGIVSAAGSMVTGNISSNNGGAGIIAASSGVIAHPGSTVNGNTTYGNGWNGIVAGYGSTVTGNTSSNNVYDGIVADVGSTVKNNTVYGNREYGINLGGQNLVDGNTAYNSNQSGEGYTNISTCGDCVFGVNLAP
jgi:parallel beta-helix repeat protein